MSQVQQALSEAFQRLSAREQRLAIATGVLVVLMLLFGIVRGAVAHVDQLDRQIAALQDSILNAHQLLTRKSIVEAQYEEVASQHSSAWSAAEIHDRLRGEIYRLAQRVPPPLKEDGTPEALTGTGGELVKIPNLSVGTLDEGGEGYREYSIPLRIPGGEFEELIDYIERLQASPQSLRIDSLDLQRDALNQKVAANLQLTRTVVDGDSSILNDETEDAPEPLQELDGMEMNLADWSSEGCALALDGNALSIESNADNANFYMLRALPAGATFEVLLDLATNSPGQLAVGDADAASVFDGATELIAEEEGAQRYRFRFTVPGESGRTRVQMPLITLAQKGAKARIEKIVVRSV